MTTTVKIEEFLGDTIYSAGRLSLIDADDGKDRRLIFHDRGVALWNLSPDELDALEAVVLARKEQKASAS